MAFRYRFVRFGPIFNEARGLRSNHSGRLKPFMKMSWCLTLEASVGIQTMRTEAFSITIFRELSFRPRPQRLSITRSESGQSFQRLFEPAMIFG